MSSNFTRYGNFLLFWSMILMFIALGFLKFASGKWEQLGIIPALFSYIYFTLALYFTKKEPTHAKN